MFDFLKAFITEIDRNTVRISAKQACDFAKGIAGDFNPIHDHDSKRFCVPGDLLFTESIRRLGLYQSMHFDFMDMLAAHCLTSRVGAGTIPLLFFFFFFFFIG